MRSARTGHDIIYLSRNSANVPVCIYISLITFFANNIKMLIFERNLFVNVSREQSAEKVTGSYIKNHQDLSVYK